MRTKRNECRPTYDILFDVGATSVGVGVVHHGKTGTDLVWHKRVDYAYEVYDDYERYKRTMFATLLDIGMQLMSEGARTIRETHTSFRMDRAGVTCVLAPPWFFAFVQQSEEERQKQFTVTQATIDALHHQAVTQALSEQQAFASWADVVGEYEVLEALPQELRLDGYEVEAWNHKHVQKISMSSFYAVMAQDVHTQVLEILERVLPNHDASMCSSTSLTTNLFEQNVAGGAGGHASLVEILGQITSVTSVRHGRITAVRAFPLGTNSVLRAAAPDAVSAHEAQGALTVTAKELEREGGSVPATVQKALTEWYAQVQEELRTQSQGVTPPELVLVMVGMNWYPFVLPLLAEPWLLPGIREERPMVVTPCSDFVLAKHEGSDVPKNAIQDSRLQVFTYALQYRCV